jgi:hypothetical protein
VNDYDANSFLFGTFRLAAGGYWAKKPDLFYETIAQPQRVISRLRERETRLKWRGFATNQLRFIHQIL